jgi:hypothetical protein
MRLLGKFYRKTLIIYKRNILHKIEFWDFDSDDDNSKSFFYFEKQSNFKFNNLPD